MITVQDVVSVVAENSGQYTFSYDRLGLSLEDFQLVVDLVREADQRGLVTIYKEHPSGTGVGVDCVVVSELTDLGQDFLAR